MKRSTPAPWPLVRPLASFPSSTGEVLSAKRYNNLQDDLLPHGFVCRFVQSAETAGKGPADRAEWNLLKANIFEVNWLLAAKGGNVASSFLFITNLLWAASPDTLSTTRVQASRRHSRSSIWTPRSPRMSTTPRSPLPSRVRATHLSDLRGPSPKPSRPSLT